MKKKARKRSTPKGRGRPTSKETPPRSSRMETSGWVLALILLGAVLIYLPCLDYQFVFDDHKLVEHNSLIKSLPNALSSMLNPLSYRPVRGLSYALDYAIGGGGPMTFHLSNLIYHVMVLLAFWLVLREIIGRTSVVLCALALFALHPVHLDAVVYISGRRDLLSSLFSLLAFWFFLRYRKTRRLWLWAPVLICFMLAFFSKEMGIVVPIMILLYEWLDELSRQKSGRTVSAVCKSFFLTLKKGLGYYGIMLGAGVVFVGCTFFNKTVSGQFGWWGGNIITNVLTAAKVFCYYIFILLIPITLRADYSYDSFPIAFHITDIAGIAAALLILFLVVFFIRRAAAGSFQLSFWALWFFAMLLPVAQIVPHHELLAEHYLYLASMGVCVLAALGLVRLYENRRMLAVGLGVAVGIFWGISGASHMKVYANDYSLFADVLEKAPDCIRANLFMGRYYFLQGAYPSAKPYYQRIVDLPIKYEREGIRPEDLPQLWQTFQSNRNEYISREVGYLIDAYKKLVKIHRSMGDKEAAIDICKKGVRKFNALYNDLGKIYADDGQYEEAVTWFQKALEGNTYSGVMQSSVYYNLGTAYLGLNKLEEAERNLKESLVDETRTRAGHVGQAHYYLAAILIRQGAEKTDIINHLKAALKAGIGEMEAKNARRLLREMLEKRPRQAKPAK